MNSDEVASTFLMCYPDLQAVYLFGSFGSEYERADSDVDFALLLPVGKARVEAPLATSPCREVIEKSLGMEIDLVNLRTVSTVFQNEIVNSGRPILIQDAEAVREFEMSVLSAYQKLNEERAGILQAFLQSKRAYPV